MAANPAAQLDCLPCVPAVDVAAFAHVLSPCALTPQLLLTLYPALCLLPRPRPSACCTDAPLHSAIAP